MYCISDVTTFLNNSSIIGPYQIAVSYNRESGYLRKKTTFTHLYMFIINPISTVTLVYSQLSNTHVLSRVRASVNWVPGAESGGLP